MSDHIVESVAELNKVCEHINLPFQAGDDSVLQRMRRGYTRDDYCRLVDKIRDRVPGVSLSTDVIVGFSGESDREFQRTLDLVREINFDKVHAAAYSTREGTIAARTMEDDVPSEEKKARLVALEALQEEILTEINGRRQGATAEVLVEGVRRGKYFGRDRNDKLVFFEDGADRTGQIVDVMIEKTSPWSLQGALVSPAVATQRS